MISRDGAKRSITPKETGMMSEKAPVTSSSIQHRPLAYHCVPLVWGDTFIGVFPTGIGPIVNLPCVETLINAAEALALRSDFFMICLATNAKGSGEEEIRAPLASVGLEIYVKRMFPFRRIGWK